MKRWFVLCCIGLITATAPAQKISEKCDRAWIELDSLFKRSHYQEAIPAFQVLRKECPSQREKYQAMGEEIIKFQLGRAKTPEDKAKVFKDLMSYYDESAKLVPAGAKSIAVKKGMALQQYDPSAKEEIFALLDKAFVTAPESYTDPNALMKYFELYFEKFKAGSKDITLESVLAKQEALDRVIARQQALAGKNGSASFDRVSQSAERLVHTVADCKALDAYLGKVVDQHQKDTLWIRNTAGRLLDYSCVDSPLFGRISELAQQLSPDSRSSYNLALIAYRANKKDDAARYFEQSAALATDPAEKAATYFTLASTIYYGSDPAKTKTAILKAVEAKPDFGKGYMFLAQVYAEAGERCDFSPFQKKALYLLAAETATKAGAVNNNLKGGAEKLAARYRQSGPTAEEIKASGMAGQQLSFQCWINESVAIPK